VDTLVVQLVHVVQVMDIVEIQVHIAVVVLLYRMVTVVIQHVVLVFVVLDKDFVVLPAFIAHFKDQEMMLNQLHLKVNLKEKQLITMKQRLVHNIQHAVLNEVDHWMKIMKKFMLLLSITHNLIHTLPMVFQVQIQFVKRKL